MGTPISIDVAAFARDGYAVARSAVPSELLAHLRELCGQTAGPSQARRRRQSLYGVRDLLAGSPELRAWISGSPFIDLARAVLGDAARPVKGTLFDKTAEANWPVPWHQDVTITVQEPRSVPGFEMRPVRDGSAHAIPPVDVSEGLLALRIHLDDAGPDHGALRVVPGSHLAGRMSAGQVRQWIETGREVVAGAAAGDILLMRPLLLHASSPCRSPGNRRVIHIEYFGAELPGGLQWAG